MADGPHFEKKEMAQYTCKWLINFAEIWHDDAFWHSGPISQQNFEVLKIQDGRRQPF